VLFLFNGNDTNSNHRIRSIEKRHEACQSGDYLGFEAEINAANSAYRMTSYYDWIVQGHDIRTAEKGWNKVSLAKLLTGRS
jgi:hypothetical protein